MMTKTNLSGSTEGRAARCAEHTSLIPATAGLSGQVQTALSENQASPAQSSSTETLPASKKVTVKTQKDGKLVYAAREALIALAAWRLTDEMKAYVEIGPDLRNGLNQAHDLLLDALPKTGLLAEAIQAYRTDIRKLPKESEAPSVGRGNENQSTALLIPEDVTP